MFHDIVKYVGDKFYLFFINNFGGEISGGFAFSVFFAICGICGFLGFTKQALREGFITKYTMGWHLGIMVAGKKAVGRGVFYIAVAIFSMLCGIFIFMIGVHYYSDNKYLSLPTTSIAGQVRELAGKEWNGDAINQLDNAASNGSAEAQYILAGCYYYGKGVAENQELAFRLCRRAAKKGLTLAQHMLAILYFNGIGVDVDYTKSRQWSEQAAYKNCPEAQFFLGHIYEMGRGVDKNRKLAYSWYRAAAERGFVWAQFNIGMAYYKGWGTKKNYVLARYWLRLAVEHGFAQAGYMLSEVYGSSDYEYEDRETSRFWLKRSADMGFVGAIKRLNYGKLLTLYLCIIGIGAVPGVLLLRRAIHKYFLEGMEAHPWDESIVKKGTWLVMASMAFFSLSVYGACQVFFLHFPHQLNPTVSYIYFF